MKDIQELLRPRYEVIADYPGSQHEIGAIYSDPDTGYGWREWSDKYPHLFHKLKWWEKREPEEMPEYIKVNPNEWDHSHGRVEKVVNYFGGNSCVEFINGKEGHCNYWIPATESEYLEYIQKQSL